MVKVAEAACNAFGKLQQTVDGFHDAVGQSGFHVGPDAVEVRFDGACQVAERGQTRGLGPSQPSFELCSVAARQSILS